MAAKKKTAAPAPVSGASGESALENWPVQIRLVPVQAPYFDGAHLLIAADCTAFACGSFHKGFMKDRITLIGCPKLDAADYSEKLAQIFSANNIETITVIRMEVPCCGGLEYAAAAALEKSGRDIPFNVVTVKTNGISSRPPPRFSYGLLHHTNPIFFIYTYNLSSAGSQFFHVSYILTLISSPTHTRGIPGG